MSTQKRSELVEEQFGRIFAVAKHLSPDGLAQLEWAIKLATDKSLAENAWWDASCLTTVMDALEKIREDRG